MKPVPNPNAPLAARVEEVAEASVAVEADVPEAAGVGGRSRAVEAAAVAAAAGNPAGSLLGSIDNEGRPTTSLVVRLGVSASRPSFARKAMLRGELHPAARAVFEEGAQAMAAARMA